MNVHRTRIKVIVRPDGFVHYGNVGTKLTKQQNKTRKLHTRVQDVTSMLSTQICLFADGNLELIFLFDVCIDMRL